MCLLLILQGALALEDALSKGFPIHAEIEALRNYLEGIDQDSILDLVLSSLPDETQKNGTDTLLQLNQKASYLCVLLFECMLVKVLVLLLTLNAK